MSQRIDPIESEILIPEIQILPARAKFLARGDVFADEIGMNLRGDFRNKYFESISRDSRRGLNDGLRGVDRWVDLGGENKNPDFKENNLGHVIGLLQWCNEIEDRFPSLKNAITGGSEEKWQELLMMLIMHDIGEIAVGDLCRAHPDFSNKLGKIHKRKEFLASLSMLAKYAPPAIAAQLRSLYIRFDHRLPDDVLVNFGHTLDKCQADATAAREIIPYNCGNDGAFNNPDRAYDRECSGISYAEKAARGISDKQARVQLAEFILEKVVAEYDKINIPAIGAIQSRVRDRIRANIIEL